jgi:hypothetical protein
MSSAGDARDLSHLFFCLFALDALEDLLAMYGDFAWGIDSETDLIAFDTEHRDGDIVTDDHSLPNPPGQDQHSQAPSDTEVRG